MRIGDAMDQVQTFKGTRLAATIRQLAVSLVETVPGFQAFVTGIGS